MEERKCVPEYMAVGIHMVIAYDANKKIKTRKHLCSGKEAKCISPGKFNFSNKHFE